MLKNIFLISCTLLSSSISFDSYAYPSWGTSRFPTPTEQAANRQHEKDYKEAEQEVRRRNQDLADAEKSCNINIYSTALQKYITAPRGSHVAFSTMLIVPDLQGIMNKCYKSGSLNALVQTNINAGGDPKTCRGYAPYDHSAIGRLCLQNMKELSPEQTADVSSTVDTLVKAGCSINTGLVAAAFDGNMPLAQMLLKKGGNIYKPIDYPCYKRKLSALGALNWGKIKLMTLQAQVSFRKRHASLEGQ